MLVFNIIEKGTYFRAFEFARELVKMGHSITLMATSPDHHFRHKTYFQEGVKIVATPDWCFGSMRSGWDLYNAFYRSLIVKPSEFDVVHAFETRPVNLLPALKLRNAGIPLVFDWADWFGKGGSVEERPNTMIRFFLRPVETFFEEKFRKIASATTVICKTLYERAIELGVDSRTITLVPNGFNVPKWQNIEKADARKKLGTDEKDFMIGYIGSLFPRDARLMAEAFDLVLEKVPNAKFLHVGNSQYGIMKLVKDIDRVIETGKVNLNEMVLYLAACDICWLPFNDTNANRGRFPMKFSNYLAAGKPIIATNVGDITKIILEKGVGLVTSSDAESLASGVFVLRDSPKLSQAMETASIQLSKDSKYSWREKSKLLEKVYQFIMD